ncbi:MAG: hypothetical protein COY58_01375 [Gammaproteobacteria bacterium CG_4_10_14_0_8_um_filter_38_16]|nr:MAG: hypothetical protein COY58_01375 [Gammaproteobacteria bacterium CG_4_10_14_0_8_um_filter_38_16]PJA03507.1 MAG: hypothetical protein COX72_04620 [Gammaproteobacteria bacterium CG_4_10_14_0_2_um_filter_38_22]PJB10273.1 MAG: hypothetical protein CO120_05765 [Gammaproteobacteria bacterium CG_4_9_14_3_um_filter_38_9]
MHCDYLDPTARYGELFSEYANQFRKIAFEVDHDPRCIENYIHLPSIDFLISDQTSTALERTKYLEALSYGDPGVLLASPGPSLSGLMIRELGLPEQVDFFYKEIKEKRMRTFFALTEPKKGSDASNITTKVTKKNNSSKYYLNGIKAFFGNGIVGEMGIVLARLSDSPVGIRAILITPSIMNHTVKKSVLPMFCLRGAQISIMQFDETEISQDDILGNHLSACQNGLLSIIKVFNRLRTGVGALAIGQAQAVYDICYCVYEKKSSVVNSVFAKLNMLLVSARALLHEAATKVEDNPYDSHSVSIAKINATRVAEQVIETCIEQASLTDLIENPWLLKAARDVYCWEYMEGTSAIQKMQIKKKRGLYE